MWKLPPVLLALVSLLVVFGAGQEPSGQQAPRKQSQEQPAKDDVVRISVTLVQVDAVVTDEKGHQVTDLRPEEFELLVDGRHQRITHFSYISAEPAPAASPPVKSADRAAPPRPPARLDPNRVRRTVALVVDDLSLSFESMVSVRDALKKFVDQQMQHGDLMAIIRTGAGIGALQQFTSDKRLLYAAIERVRFNMTGRARISAFAPIDSSRERLNQMAGGGRNRDGGDRDEDEIDQFREELFSVGTLGALNYIVRGLRQLPGRKSIILFSDGFRIFGRDRESYRVLEGLRRLTDLANRASVVIYTIDARVCSRSARPRQMTCRA